MKVGRQLGRSSLMPYRFTIHHREGSNVLGREGASPTLLRAACFEEAVRGAACEQRRSDLRTVLFGYATPDQAALAECGSPAFLGEPANGVYKDRKPTVPVERVRAMHKDGVGPSAIARELGISRMSVHRALNAG